MNPEPKICGSPRPQSGLRCGLYKWHREDNTPHRILKQDYPYSETVKYQSREEREWWDTRGETP